MKVEFGADNTQTPVSSSNPLPIEIFDAGGASVIKDEDAVHSTGDPGIMSLAVRNDTLAALAGTDGDYAPLQVNASGALFIQEGAALDVSGATVSVDWAGTSPPIGAGVEATALRVTLATDSTGVISVDDNGGNLSVDWAGTNPPIGAGTEAAALRVTLATDSTGVVSVDDNGSALTVDNGGTFAVQVDGDALTALQLIDNIVVVEDAVHSTGASGVMPLAVRNDTLAALAGTDGDYAPVQVNASGAVYVQEGSALDVSAANVTVVGTGTFATQVDGDALTALQLIDDSIFADDAAFTLASSKVTMSGAIRDDALSTLTAIEGDAVPLRVSSTGALHVTGGGGGTEYTLGTDTFLEGTSIGAIGAVVRKDSGASLVNTDNEITALQVDANGALRVTGGGGGTEYTQDAAHTDPATAATLLIPRDDALSTQETTDGDWTLPRANARGALWVEVDGTNALDVSAATVTVDLGANNDVTIDGSSIVKAEDAVHSTGDSGVMALSVRNDTLAALAGTDGDYAPLQVNASGALYIQEGAALDVSGATVTVDLGANNDVTIDNSSIVKAEDAVHGSGDTGVMALSVRNDTLAALAGTDGDYAPLQVNASGALYIQEGAALDVSGATVTVDLGANNDVTIDNSSIVKAEDAVHGSGDSGVMSLAVRNDTLAALAGTDGDYAPLQVSALGGMFTVLSPETTGGLSIYYDNDLDETAVAVKASAGQVYGIYAINTTAAPLYLQLFNVAQGSVTVGTTTPTVQFVIPANADSDGAGFEISLPHGIAFGTAITAACSTNSEGNGAPGANAAHVNIFYK